MQRRVRTAVTNNVVCGSLHSGGRRQRDVVCQRNVVQWIVFLPPVTSKDRQALAHGVRFKPSTNVSTTLHTPIDDVNRPPHTGRVLGQIVRRDQVLQKPFGFFGMAGRSFRLRFESFGMVG